MRMRPSELEPRTKTPSRAAKDECGRVYVYVPSQDRGRSRGSCADGVRGMFALGSTGSYAGSEGTALPQATATFALVVLRSPLPSSPSPSHLCSMSPDCSALRA